MEGTGIVTTLNLPYPPSANRYWRHLSRGPMAGRTLLSAQAREYRIEVAAECQARGLLRREDEVQVTIVLTAPDRRRRDIDNPVKPLLDALTHAGAWLDDSQVARLVVERRVPNKADAGCVVTVEGWPP